MEQGGIDPRVYYGAVVEDCRRSVRALSRKSMAVAGLRLLVFVAAFVAVVLFWHQPAKASMLFVAGMAAFLWLVKFSARISQLKDSETAKMDWAIGQIARMDLNLDGLPDGREYIDAAHDFSFDIDLFGRHSIFSLLNSTVTPFGHGRLAEWMLHPERIVDEVENRQDAIRELSGKRDFRLKLAATAWQANGDSGEIGEIPDFSIGIVRRVAVWAIVPVFVVLSVLAALGLISGNVIVYVFLAALIASSLQSKRVGRLHEWLSGAVGRLSRYSDLFKAIEEESFGSQALCAIRSRLSGKSGGASSATRQLARYLNNLDQRYNVFGFAILNGFLFWDWRQLNNIDRWMKTYSKDLEAWKDAIADMDAFCSLGAFAFNNPDYAYPVCDVDGDVVLEAKNAGHPLISRELCVRNNVETLRESSFFVVTGANMAGKSTYLRTVAVNYLLAEIGAPVCAEEMTFSKASLFTGIRTSDSLAEGASYFFAELSRLEKIVRRAESGERMFVVLDEILRGTNSADKQKGSLGLVGKLVKLPVAGIIATHDLALGSLAETFPKQVRNFRFEADIEGERLTFSYRIRTGVAENANASFLMKQMGII